MRDPSLPNRLLKNSVAVSLGSPRLVRKGSVKRASFPPKLRSCVERNAAGPLEGSPAAAYLAARHVAAPEPAYMRCHPMLGYFHGGRRVYAGPAMLVLFVRPGEAGWQPIGLHRTWVAPDNPPKFRPTIVDPHTKESLVSKKMRGSKAGGLLPLAGRYSRARRFVGGEGIETGLGYAAREGFRADTFYFAAGDLGNLAGKATRESRVKDTTKHRLDRNGRRRAVFVPGAEPDLGSAAVPIPYPPRSIGVISVSSLHENAFTPEHLEALGAVTATRCSPVWPCAAPSAGMPGRGAPSSSMSPRRALTGPRSPPMPPRRGASPDGRAVSPRPVCRHGNGQQAGCGSCRA